VNHYYNEEGVKVMLSPEEISKNRNERKDADAHGLIKLRIVSPFKLEFDEKKGSNMTMK